MQTMPLNKLCVTSILNKKICAEFVYFLFVCCYFWVQIFGNPAYKITEVGKAQLEAQSATSATSAIAEVALRFNFLFWNIAEVALRNKAFKICCALIALRF